MTYVITNHLRRKALGLIVFLTLASLSFHSQAGVLISRINMTSHNHNHAGGKVKSYDTPIVEWHEDLDMLSVVFICDEPTLLSVECSDGGIITQFPITTDGWENYYWIGAIPTDTYTIIIENDYARFEGELIIP